MVPMGPPGEDIWVRERERDPGWKCRSGESLLPVITRGDLKLWELMKEKIKKQLNSSYSMPMTVLHAYKY